MCSSFPNSKCGPRPFPPRCSAFATAAEAREALIRLVEAAGVKKAVVVESPLQKAAGITEALRSRGIAVYTEPEEIAAHADTADIGISGVEFGVAETGSVFQDGYAIATRLVTILPPLHVVFLPSANIVPGITEAFEIIAKNFDRGYVGLHHGTEPDRRHRAGAHHRRPRPGPVRDHRRRRGAEGRCRLMEAEARNLRKEISEKLKDETLRGALGRFAEVYPEARAKAYANAGDIETLREAVKQMKIATVAEIEKVADRFEAEATKRGREGLPGEGRRRRSRPTWSISARKKG